MRQVVAADRKPVVPFGEIFREEYVRRDFAHHENLQAVFTPVQPVFREHLVHPAGLVQRADKRDHHHNVVETDLFASSLDRAALQGKSVAIIVAIVARGSAKTEHRVFFFRLELGAADQVGVLIRLEVAHPHNRRLWILRSGDGRNPARQMVDEVFRLVFIAARVQFACQTLVKPLAVRNSR